ncbi:MAG TPA: hypothetical protein VN822_00720 [Candidatus Acidoferrales bacterium]|nr:hypothetical protein [Candidatus Acidoferrales bacterium]
MRIRQFAAVWVCLTAIALAEQPARAQNCTGSQDAAVQCFVGNAVRTNLTSLRYGMTMSQFKSYGVAISKVLQAQQAYLVLAGMSSAIADAMPPTNADGTANIAAQQAAVYAIVHAEILNDLLTIPAEVNEQQLKWLSLDMVSSMNETNGIMLSPGFFIRITDSYITTATSNGVVNWTLVNANVMAMVNNLAGAGLLKLPPSMTLSQAQGFAGDLAQAIYNYKLATGRKNL